MFLEARGDGPEVRERAEDHSQRLHGGNSILVFRILLFGNGPDAKQPLATATNQWFAALYDCMRRSTGFSGYSRQIARPKGDICPSGGQCPMKMRTMNLL